MTVKDVDIAMHPLLQATRRKQTVASHFSTLISVIHLPRLGFLESDPRKSNGHRLCSLVSLKTWGANIYERC